MPQPRQGNSVLITGCSSGIGRCAALGLRARGYRVFATARKPADVEALATQGLESLPLDLDRPQSIREALEQVLERSDGRPSMPCSTMAPVVSPGRWRTQIRGPATMSPSPPILFGYLRCVLSTRALDRMLRRVSGDGSR